MENILRFGGDNLGSILGIQLVKASAVISIPEPNTNYITSEILMSDTTQKSGIVFTPQTCGFGETSDLTPQGRLWQKLIVFNIPKVCPDVNEWIYENAEEGFIAILHDANEYVNIVGDLDFPLKIRKLKADRKITMEERNQYDFTLEVSHKYQSYFYMMYEPLPDGTRRIFSNAFILNFE